MNRINRAIRQDKHIDDFRGYSRAALADVGVTGGHDEGFPRLVPLRIRKGKYEPVTVRNLSKTNRTMKIAEETEKIYHDNVYPIQYYSRKKRKQLKTIKP